MHIYFYDAKVAGTSSDCCIAEKIMDCIPRIGDTVFLEKLEKSFVVKVSPHWFVSDSDGESFVAITVELIKE